MKQDTKIEAVEEKTEVLMSIPNICLLLKISGNTRSYIEHKYKDKSFTEKQWKENLKKDGLSL